jgi:hypothetical protein
MHGVQSCVVKTMEFIWVKVDLMVGGCEADEAGWFYQPRNFSLGHSTITSTLPVSFFHLSLAERFLFLNMALSRNDADVNSVPEPRLS